MASKVLLLVGTKEGRVHPRERRRRRILALRGPFCDDLADQPRHRPIPPPARSMPAAATSGSARPCGSPTDLGASWTHSSAGPRLRGGRGRRSRRSGALRRRGGRLYAGVEPAGLFRSDDGGQYAGSMSRACASIRRAPHWQPGGAGLILHSHRAAPDRRERDLGRHLGRRRVPHRRWRRRPGSRATSGTRADYMPEEQRYPEYGQCVHCLVMAPGMPRPALPAEPLRHVPQRRWRPELAEHRGRPAVDLRLPGGGASARPRHALPRCRSTATSPAATCPTARPPSGARATRGTSWQALREGLPQENAFFGVLRQAMATDRLEPAGVYFGTSTGALYASADEGDSWTLHRAAPAADLLGRDAGGEA